MLNNITIGQYYPVDSVIHRLDPRTKLAGTLLFIVALFGFEDVALDLGEAVDENSSAEVVDFLAASAIQEAASDSISASAQRTASIFFILLSCLSFYRIIILSVPQRRNLFSPDFCSFILSLIVVK